jgi:hypothetical protein
MTDPHPYLSCLTSQHDRVLAIIEGLDEHQLRSSVLPSGWSPLAMIGHLRETTCFWTLEVMRDEHPSTPVPDPHGRRRAALTGVPAGQ